MKPAAMLGRAAALLVVAGLAMELAFAARVLLLLVCDPASTPFQRSEIARLLVAGNGLQWHQTWVPYEHIALPLKRAVVASEDAGFLGHHGVEWTTIDRAWQRNLLAAQRAERAERANARSTAPGGKPVTARIVGGSTITQQLVKNLFLSGERTLPRKAQEIVLAYLVDALLGKRRILELYLNSVEWGSGVFGAEAAAERHARTRADLLGPAQAARLAVMLPAPKLYERRPDSPFLRARAAAVAARMSAVAVP